MSSHKITGPLVLEKIFEGFIPYMGMAAILVMWPRLYEQTLVLLSLWGSIWNLASIGQAVLEKKIFENGGRRIDDDGPWLYFKLTNQPKGSGELKMCINNDLKMKCMYTCRCKSFNVHYLMKLTDVAWMENIH